MLLVLTILHVIANPSFSFDNQIIDSLENVITENLADSSVAEAHISLSDILYVQSLDTVVYHCEIAKQIAELALEDPDLSIKSSRVF